MREEVIFMVTGRKSFGRKLGTKLIALALILLGLFFLANTQHFAALRVVH